MAVNSELTEKFVEECYEQMTTNPANSRSGIDYNNLLLILTVEKKNKDMGHELLKAFEVLELGDLTNIDVDQFKDMLMFNGYR